MENKIPLIIIAGPTGIGKSALAINIAEKLNTEIISADSRQIYLDFNIGTAKPSISEKDKIKHHLVDFYPPTKIFTVAQYIEQVNPLIRDISQKGKIPMLVGGTGLYIKSVVEGFEIPKTEPLKEYRDELKKEAEQKGNSFLYEKAKKIDPIAMEKIHENDLFRVIRVLEVYKSTGKLFSSLKRKATEPIYDLIYVGLDLDREKLYERIAFRVEKMIELGLIEEVKFLIEKYGTDLKLLDTINYREIRDYLQGKCSLEEAIEMMKKDTRHFAKRQLTWFRNDPWLTWKNSETNENKKDILEYILQEIRVRKMN